MMNIDNGPGLSPRRIPVDPERVNERDFQIAALQLLTEILAELQRANSIEPTGAVSSCEIHDLAPTKDRPNPLPQCHTKVYAGSIPPVEDAVVAHAQLKKLAEEAAMHGWYATAEYVEKNRSLVTHEACQHPQIERLRVALEDALQIAAGGLVGSYPLQEPWASMKRALADLNQDTAAMAANGWKPNG